MKNTGLARLKRKVRLILPRLKMIKKMHWWLNKIIRIKNSSENTLKLILVLSDKVGVLSEKFEFKLFKFKVGQTVHIQTKNTVGTFVPDFCTGMKSCEGFKNYFCIQN